MDTATDRMAKLRELSQHIGRADFMQVAERIAREVKAAEAEPEPEHAPHRHSPHHMTGAPRRPATLKKG